MLLVSITSMKNQASSARTIAEAYLKSSRLPDLSIFVLDRCSDATEEILDSVLSHSRLNYVLLKSTWDDNIFAAGRPRDFAINHVRLMGMSPDIYVFLDGDCSPSRDLFREHENAHAVVFPYPCLVNSSRIEEDIDGTMLCDPRLKNPHVLCPGKDVVTISDENLYVGASMVPSCIGANLSMNSHALCLARETNQKCLGRSRVFAHVFDGQWGGEDPYLAATLFRLHSLLVNLDPLKAHVIHHYHPTTHRTRNHVRVLADALRVFNAAIVANTIQCPATTETSVPRIVELAASASGFNNTECSRVLAGSGDFVYAGLKRQQSMRTSPAPPIIELSKFSTLIRVDYETQVTKTKHARTACVVSGILR